MARLPRFDAPDVPQHIIQRGNNRQAIFADAADYEAYVEWLGEAASDQGLDVHAYVLMTNHVHLLATPRKEGAVGRTMQSLGRRYVQYFNRIYDRTGTLWEGRYRATVIDAEGYLLACMRYIDLNPVRAGMVSNPREYVWSSYAHYALGRADGLLREHEVYVRLASEPVERRKAYRALVKAAPDTMTDEAIREATNKGWALGNDRFRKEIEALTRRRAGPLPKGRPRQSTS